MAAVCCCYLLIFWTKYLNIRYSITFELSVYCTLYSIFHTIFTIFYSSQSRPARKNIQIRTQTRNSPSIPVQHLLGQDKTTMLRATRDTQPTISSNSTERTETCPHLSRGVAKQCAVRRVPASKDERHNHHQTGACPSRLCGCVCVFASHVERMCARVGSKPGAEHTIWGRLSWQRDVRFSCSCSRFIALQPCDRVCREN